MFDLRRMSKADTDAVAMFTARIFAPDNVEMAWEQLRMAYAACPFMPIDLCWALEEDNRVVFQWQLLDYTLRIGRATVRAAGCFGLASAEDARGQHHMLTVAKLGRSIPADQGFDVLLGFAKDSRGFLQMEGTVALGPECRWSMPLKPLEQHLDAAQDVHGASDGFAQACDDAAIAQVVHWHNTCHTGVCNIVRTPQMWPWMLRKPPEIFICEQGYIGLRQHENVLEIREAAGETQVFYARALAFAQALARQRKLTGLSGHLPPEHPLVAESLSQGASITADYTQKSGSFAGLMRPESFMEKLAVELEHRFVTCYPKHRLNVHVQTFEGGPIAFTHVYNKGATNPVSLHLDVPTGALFQLCMGYAQARAVLRQHPERARAWVSAGELDVDAVLAALFPKATPFIVHADRY